MGFDSLAQVMVYVSNPAASARFWTERLGFVLREKVPGPDGTDGSMWFCWRVAP